MNNLKSAVLLFLGLTVLLGGAYPAAVTVAAHFLFPRQAGGSLVVAPDGRLIGSRLLGQSFTEPGFFWSRPSATAGGDYNPLASGGSNFGPTHPDLLRQTEARVNQWRLAGITGAIPADLASASASGLDPHISPAAALLQVERVARARNMSPEKIRALVLIETEGRQAGLFGEPRVNVLALNMALERLSPRTAPAQSTIQ